MTAYNIVGASTLVAGQPEDVSQVLANFQAIQNVINGNLDSANLKAAAGVTLSQLGQSGASANQVPLWNGSAWVPSNPASGGMSNPMTAVGDLILGGAGGAPTRLPIGAAGMFATSNGSSIVYNRGNAGTWAVGDAPNTTSTGNVMGGFGGSVRLTPQVTGRVITLIFFRIPNVTNTNLFVQGCVGTGGAPGAGAAYPGGAFTTSVNGNSSLSTTLIALANIAVGTNAWFDLTYSVDSGSTYGGNSPRGVTFVLFEV